jgi:hypothetical protein
MRKEKGKNLPQRRGRRTKGREEKNTEHTEWTKFQDCKWLPPEKVSPFKLIKIYPEKR